MRMEISIIIPTYNEAENIKSLIQKLELVSRRDDISLEIIIVDDNSSDGTADIAQSMNETFGNIKALKHQCPYGIAKAILHGAFIASHEVLVTMDADFSHPPECVPELVKRMSDSDMVVCSRYVKDGKMNAPFFRCIISRVGNFLAKVLLRSSIYDLTGGFQAFRKNVLNQVELTSVYGEYSIELITKLQRRGCKIREIPFTYNYRSRGRSKTHLVRASIWYLWKVLRFISD